ncbi:zinc-binding dehydrogenase [Mycolicibacterium sp. XJ1819]
MRAAVLWNTGDDEVDVTSDVTLTSLGPNDVRVRLAASGLCQTDISAMSGAMPTTTPAILGHEGAGEIVAVGDRVEHLSPRDHVILSFVPACGRCRFCLGQQANLCVEVIDPFAIAPRFDIHGTPGTGFSGLGTWAEEIVVPHQAAIPIPDDIPLDIAALLGCAVMTGVGAAIKTAAVRPGSLVVVVGCGGIGLSVIQGARAAGAAHIIGVDPSGERREAAKALGAHTAVAPEELSPALAGIHDGVGADYAFEAVGRAETIRSAFDITRKGGTTIVVGAGKLDEQVVFSAFELFYFEKTLKGSLYGSADARTDFGRLLEMWRGHQLDLEALVSHRIKLDDINAGIDRMRRAEGLRQLLVYGT